MKAEKAPWCFKTTRDNVTIEHPCKTFFSFETRRSKDPNKSQSLTKIKYVTVTCFPVGQTFLYTNLDIIILLLTCIPCMI